ncbi:MAG: hypothetical protein HC800_06240 [Phormidesmis sp. RL_2_1]|nr:hypothetical protein [Phormidesmis sp. RL_2_1]
MPDVVAIACAGCITPTARLRQRVQARRLARCHVMVSANMLYLSQATKAIFQEFPNLAEHPSKPNLAASQAEGDSAQQPATLL